jgi:hypothetical protein
VVHLAPSSSAYTFSCSTPKPRHHPTCFLRLNSAIVLYKLTAYILLHHSASLWTHVPFPRRSAFSVVSFEDFQSSHNMYWLPKDQNGHTSLGELQLDIVGFLAILGEGSVLANAQVSTLSRWIFLPRLIPAPQALMRPTRPIRLETFPGHVTGIVSGNNRDDINHIGNIVW